MGISTLEELKNAFCETLEKKYCYLGVAIKMPDLPMLEIIINPYENLTKKLEYYLKAYNDNLELKTFDKIKIVGVEYGDWETDILSNLMDLNDVNA